MLPQGRRLLRRASLEQPLSWGKRAPEGRSPTPRDGRCAPPGEPRIQAGGEARAHSSRSSSKGRQREGQGVASGAGGRPRGVDTAKVAEGPGREDAGRKLRPLPTRSDRT